MNSAFKSRTNNISIGAFDSLFSAVDFSDTSTLWERKAGLVKSINDNKIDVMGPLIGALLESLHFLFSPKKKFSSFSFQSLSKLSAR